MTMRPPLLMTALALLLAAPIAAPAQETRYRVEVIVLTHLDHAEAPRDMATIRDYGDALDFLAPAETDESDEDADEAGEAASDDQPESVDAGTLPPATELGASETEPEPPAVVHIEELGDVMQDAWRRLRLSGPFRPLLSLAWEQPDTPPFPLLRVHDENVVMTQDPWAAIRGRLEEGEPVDAWIEAGLVPPIPPASPETDVTPETEVTPDAVGTPLTSEVDPDDNPQKALLERLPPPRPFYALDGTISLVRSRFLHLYVDLQQREGVYESVTPQSILLPRGLQTPPTATAPPDTEGEEPVPAPSAFRVFELEQTRQVKTGQIEYFDGPVLSVLAYITAIEPETGENGPR